MTSLTSPRREERDADVAACVAAAFAHLAGPEGRAVVEERDTSKGCDHTVKILRVGDDPAQRLVLKIPRREPDKVQRTVRCAEICARVGCPAPRTVYVDPEGAWLLEECAEGRDLDAQRPVAEEQLCAWYRSLGAAMARLHSVPASGAGFFAVEGDAVVGEEPAGPEPAAEHDEAAWAALVEAGVVSAEQYAALRAIWRNPPTEFSPALLHGDVSDDNVMAEGDRLALIDFGDAYVGDRPADFARLLLFRGGTPAWDALLEGYGELPGADRVQFHAAALLAWVLPGRAPEQCAKWVGRLGAVLSR